MSCAGDIQYLYAAADREHRYVGVGGSPNQFELIRVASCFGRFKRWMRRCSIDGRQHVVPAGQQNPVDLADDVGRRVGRIVEDAHFTARAARFKT